MQIGISLGMVCFIFIKRERIFLPNYRFLFIVFIFILYYLWREKWHIETFASVTLYCSILLLFYQFFINEIDRDKLFNVCTVLAILLCLWCVGQFIGWLPSYHNTLRITGPFDNPAGISACLSLLLPFILYGVVKNRKWKQIFYIAISITIIAFVILSGARTAMIAITVIILAYVIRWTKTRTKINFLAVHYCLLGAMGVLLLIGLYFIKKDSANGRILIWKCT